MNSEKKIEITDELITRYVAGEADPDEALALSDWLKDRQNRQHFQSFEEAWRRSARIQPPVFSHHVSWPKVANAVHIFSNREKRMHLRWTPMHLSIAATLLLAVVAFLYLVKRNDETLPVSQQILSTAGQAGVFYLSDSSKVTLFRNSTLKVPADFKESGRSVTLDAGEAFFEVRHDGEKPFLVHTPGATIRVVGTSFNVILEPKDLHVSVRDGKVLVYNSTDSAFLTGGHQAILKSGSRSFETRKTEDVNRWSYATGKLVFRDAPLAQVIVEIEKTYPDTIRLTNENIGKCRVTATFDGDSVDKIVDLISEILNVTIQRDGRTFTLDGEGCP